ncbi:MAG: 16S rRNA processing protein RimM [Alphaproteobacteria bacterium]|nr:16S rRNA processing protein RimM [Alphaproteobacteria bacterium]
MNIEDKILVGKIVAPQGIRGECRVQTFSSKPTDFQKFHIISAKFNSEQFHFVRVLKQNVIIAKIDGFDDRNAIESLRGTELFISHEDLPNLKENEYYQSDLIGFEVIRGDKKIGIVDGFQNFGAGDIIELDNGEMVSFKNADVDIKNKTIVVL